MRKLLGTSTLLFSLAGTVVAQAPAHTTQPASPLVVLQSNVASLSTGCPAGFAATRLPAQGLHATDRSQDPGSEPTKASLDLSLPSRERMVSAKVRLFGLAGPTVVPVDAVAPHGSAQEELFVTFHPGEQKRVHGVARSVRLTGVQWVELRELDYGNGNVWHEASEGACRIAPSGFRLVAATAN